MKLTLSSAAAPEASLDELLAACGRKGLGGLELTEGDGHGVGTGPDELSLATARARAGGVALTGLRLAGPDAVEGIESAGAAGLPPLVVPLVDGPGSHALLRSADALARAGRSVALASHDARLLASAARCTDAPTLAWDFTPGSTDPADLHALLGAAGARLAHVRLFGGGPETVGQAGGGIGTLLAGLAVAAFRGALVVTPTSPRFRVAWGTWLGRRAGSGCSGKATAAEPLPLRPPPGAFARRP